MMRKALAVTVCLAALVCASAANAQTACVPQTRTQLLNSFADNVPPASITPQTMRNLVCSVLNLNLNLVGQSLALSGGVSPVLSTPGVIVDGSGNTTVNTLQVSGSGSLAINSPGFSVNSSGNITGLAITGTSIAGTSLTITGGTSALAAITGTTLVLGTTISAGAAGFLVDATGNVTALSLTGGSGALAIAAATTGTVSIGNVTGGVQFKVSNTASAVDFVNVTGGAAGTPGTVTVSALGTDTNINLALASKGTGGIPVSTGGGEQLQVNNTATAVDFVTVTGGAAGTPGVVTVGASGTDTNIAMAITPKGTGSVQLTTGGGEQFEVDNTASAVDFVTITGSAAGTPGAVAIGTSGTDTNINIVVTPKGSGVLKLGNAGSFTANGSVATTMTSLGPTGSHATIQEWFTVQDSAGTVRYIPAY